MREKEDTQDLDPESGVQVQEVLREWIPGRWRGEAERRTDVL